MKLCVVYKNLACEVTVTRDGRTANLKTKIPAAGDSTKALEQEASQSAKGIH